MQIVSTHNLARTMIRLTSRNQTAYHAELIRVSSGKNHALRSGNCPETARIAELERETVLGDQLVGNLRQGSVWVSVSEARVAGVLDVVARMREIAVEAGDTTTSATARTTLALELDGLLEDLLSLANSTHEGAALFGGTGTESPATAVRDADGRMLSVVYGSGAETVRSLQAGSSVVEYGVTAVGPDGLFAGPGGSQDIFLAAIELRDQIESGGGVEDMPLAELGQAFDRVTLALVRTGLQGNRLEQLSLRAEDAALTRQGELSDLSETDLASAAMRLAELEASLQASLSMAATLGRLSLLNHL